jgi:hypothetical protein
MKITHQQANANAKKKDICPSNINHTNDVLQVNAFPITVMFGMCAIFLFMAAILQRRLMVVSDLHRSTSMFPTMIFNTNKCNLLIIRCRFCFESANYG